MADSSKKRPRDPSSELANKKQRPLMTFVAKPPAVPALRPESESLCIPSESFESLSNWYNDKQNRRDAVARNLQAIQRLCGAAIHALHRGEMPQAKVLIQDAFKDLKEAISELGDEEDGRFGPMSGAIEACIKAKAMCHFFETGKLVRHDEVSFASNEEYLQGVITFASELQRYAVKQAGAKDLESLLVCKKLVESMNAQLMLFDFRNGPLRHKYDGIKYVVRKLEDTIFELSLQPGIGAVADDNQAIEESDASVPETELIIKMSDFEKIRGEMEAYDEKRETVIKKCRDMQKASKNSIYDLHRGNLERAKSQLDQVLELTKELLPMIEENKGLRSGSFSNVMEEYAEGKLFYHFLKDKRVLGMEELAPINAHEFMGGILDLTGEIGRYAVASATKRDMEAVQMCQEAVDRIVGQVLVLNGLPGNVHKKIDQAKITLRKLDNILYELSLARKSSAVSAEEATGEGPKPSDDA